VTENITLFDYLVFLIIVILLLILVCLQVIMKATNETSKSGMIEMVFLVFLKKHYDGIRIFVMLLFHFDFKKYHSFFIDDSAIRLNFLACL